MASENDDEPKKRIRLSEGFVWANTYIPPLVMHIGSNVTLTREDGQIRSMTFSREEIVRLAKEVMSLAITGNI